MQQLKDQTAIVTGGGSGIGRAAALALAEASSNVVICGRRQAALDAVIQEIEDSGGIGRVIQADVAEVADVQRLVQETVDTFGRVDIVINNAGIDGGTYIHEHDVDDWDRVIAVNLRGPFLLARTVLPLMRAQEQGHIINISSESGIEHYPGNGVYGVTKHALNALGELMQQENQDLNIRVNTICPGMVVTEMTEHLPGLDLDKSLAAEDIADLVLWLLTRQPNIKIGLPVLIQTMANPWA